MSKGYKRYSINMVFTDGTRKTVKKDNYLDAWNYYMNAETALASELKSMDIVDNNSGEAFQTWGEEI